MFNKAKPKYAYQQLSFQPSDQVNTQPVPPKINPGWKAVQSGNGDPTILQQQEELRVKSCTEWTTGPDHWPGHVQVPLKLSSLLLGVFLYLSKMMLKQ